MPPPSISVVCPVGKATGERVALPDVEDGNFEYPALQIWLEWMCGDHHSTGDESSGADHSPLVIAPTSWRRAKRPLRLAGAMRARTASATIDSKTSKMRGRAPLQRRRRGLRRAFHRVRPLCAARDRGSHRPPVTGRRAPAISTCSRSISKRRPHGSRMGSSRRPPRQRSGTEVSI
jgi:hypothetical protein